ncbi:MAG: hypothetical protein Kow00128_12050 [Deltaproteobacteria bacterium]
MSRKEAEETLRAAKYSVRTAADFGKGWEILRRDGGKTVVLTELTVGGGSALAFLAKTLRRYPQVPFILLAKSPPLESVIEALKQGAYDFLRKPVAPGILTHAVARSVERLNLSIDAERQEQEIRELLARSREDLTKVSTLNAFKSFLISTAAHDFRALLTVLDGYHQMLKEKCLGCTAGAQIDLLTQARRSIGRLRTMCATLLDYDAAERGELILSIAPIDLANLLRECVDFYRPFAEQKRIRLELEECDHPLQVRGDRGRVLQVLDNLLYNAIKFTPSEGEIRVGSMKGEESSAIIWVRDSGDGIPASLQEKILNGDRSVVAKDGNERIGIGLMICRKLLELQQGRLWFEGEPGHGLKVLFSLPV